MALEYVIYCDESTQKGKYFSNFYGGALVRSTDLAVVESTLKAAALAENLTGEVKWSKVTQQYLGKYESFVTAIFDLVAADRVKIRVMFTQNSLVPVGLTQEQQQGSYLRLYYQFVKHSFGLDHSNPERRPLRIRVNLDQLPSTADDRASFKAYLCGLSRFRGFQAAGVAIRAEDIAEVTSHDHIILQALDVVLGAMQFRLNNLHREKPPGAFRRGARTVAKERLYKHILGRIRAIYPNFNIGISTGGSVTSRWTHPYRHWRFVASNHKQDPSKRKPK